MGGDNVGPYFNDFFKNFLPIIIIPQHFIVKAFGNKGVDGAGFCADAQVIDGG